MIKNKRGSVSVEASLVLILFIFFFISIILICKLARTQVVLQHGVNQIAGEISKYSYIANKLELVKEKGTNEAVEKTDKLVGEIGNFAQVVNTEKEKLISGNLNNGVFDLLGAYKNAGESSGGLDDSIDIIVNSGTGLANSFKEYFKDPVGIINGFAQVAKDEISNYAVSKFVLSPLCKLLLEKYVGKTGESTHETLVKMGVNNGIDGVNFDASTIFNDGKTVNVTAFYTMTIDLPLLIKRDFVFKVSASTISWGSELDGSGGGVQEGDSEKKDNKDNIWDITWEERTYEFAKIIQKERGLVGVRIPLPLDFYNEGTNLLTYVHSMNTTLKSYCNENSKELDLEQIKSTIKKYCKDAIEDCKKTREIVLEDGRTVIADGDKKIKVIMVLHKDSIGENASVEKIIEEIKRELNYSDIDIELYYSDGER